MGGGGGGGSKGLGNVEEVQKCRNINFKDVFCKRHFSFLYNTTHHNRAVACTFQTRTNWKNVLTESFLSNTSRA